jgi:hypothetical protein
LVALHTDVPGLDAAAVGALWRVHTKEIWPVMADLLDSKDQLGAASIAARCFAVYAAGVDMRPETQAYMPAMKSTATPAELIVFWREWWMEHKERLGYQ